MTESSRPPETPYRGIEAFRYSDRLIFFAREAEARDLLRRIAVFRGVLLYGESGTGKSSLINAGLIPEALLENFAPDRLRIQPRPGEEVIVERIPLTAEGPTPQLPSNFAEDSNNAARIVLSLEAFKDRAASLSPDRHPLLIFDQFEELISLFEEAPGLSLERGRALQEAIVDVLVELLRDESLPIKLLFVFREDYLAKVLELFVMRPELADQYVRLTAPRVDALKEIVRGPFERFPGRFRAELSPDLAQRLAEAIRSRSESRTLNLSEVEIVCLRLWGASNPEELLGQRGVQGLLEEYLWDALDRFDPDLRYPAVALLSRMVTASGLRNVISAEDLINRVRDEENIAEGIAKRALDDLEVEAKLVRRELRHNVYVYEIVSEFLVPWITEQREASRTSRELAEAHAAAETERRRAEEERRRADEQARVSRRLRLLAGLLAIVVLLAVGAAVFAVREQTRAERQQTLAEEQAGHALARGLAARAVVDLVNDRDLAVLFSLEAFRREDTSLTRSILLRALQASPYLGSILQEAESHPLSAAFSPDGKTLATARSNGMTILWDVATRQRLGELPGHKGLTVTLPLVPKLAFSPDGRTLASSSSDGIVTLWDVATRQSLGELDPEEPVSGFVPTVAFSPDGETLASADVDGTVTLWDLATRQPVGKLPPVDSGPVRVLAFSPDGETLATGSLLGTLTLWGVDARRRLGEPLARNLGIVRGLAFTPDGETLASGSSDGTVILWNVASRRSMRLPRGGHRDDVTSVAFSPDGDTLASGSLDGSVILWDVATSRFPGTSLTGHTGYVTSVAFSPDGETLASGSFDGRVILWDVASRTPLTGHARGVTSVAFSPNGETLASGSLDGTVILWNLPTRQQIGPPLASQNGAVTSLAFNPADGEMLASSKERRTIILWDVATRQPAGELLTGNKGSVSSVAFSPDGKTLASGSDNGTVTLWDVATRQFTGELVGHTDSVASVAFSPDGKTLASGSSDGTVILWDVATRRLLGEPFTDHPGGVTSVVFSRDGETLASGSDDGTVILWPAGIDTWRSLACKVVGRNLTREEWERYIGENPYRATCPGLLPAA